DRRALTDSHVPKLTGRAVFTTIDLTVENDSRTDAAFNEHENEVTHFANLRSSKPQLRLRGRVRVVVHRHRQSSRVTDLTSERQVAPLESGNEQLFAFGIDESGKADANAFDRTVISPDEFFRAIDDLFRGLVGVGICCKLFLVYHTAGEIACGNDRVIRTHIDTDRNSVCRTK